AVSCALSRRRPAYAGHPRACKGFRRGTAYRIRTGVTAVRGRRPRPLDECGARPKAGGRLAERLPPALGERSVPGTDFSRRAQHWGLTPLLRQAEVIASASISTRYSGPTKPAT